MKKNSEKNVFRSKNVLDEFFLFLQYLFIGNSLNEKVFGQKFFIVPKSLPRKQDEKILVKKFVGRKCFGRMLLVENFLLSQNHFLRNSWQEFFFSTKIFEYCKIISSETL